MDNPLYGFILTELVTNKGKLPVNYNVIRACCNAFADKILSLNADGYL